MKKVKIYSSLKDISAFILVNSILLVYHNMNKFANFHSTHSTFILHHYSLSYSIPIIYCRVLLVVVNYLIRSQLCRGTSPRMELLLANEHKAKILRSTCGAMSTFPREVV